MHSLHNFLNNHAPNGLKIELTNPQAIRFAYYFKMKFDVQNIQALLQSIDVVENRKDILDIGDFNSTTKILFRQSLWVNSIVTYARLFNDKSYDKAGIRHIRLHKDQCYKNATSDILSMHDTLIEIRNLYISHGVENDQEHIIPYMFITGIGSNGETLCNFGVNSLNPISYSTTDNKTFQEMIEKLLSYIVVKLNELADILFEGYKNIDSQTLYDLAINKGKL